MHPELRTAIKQGKKITIIAYQLSKRLDRQVNIAIALLLTYYQRTDLHATLSRVIQEMISTAFKANSNHLYKYYINANELTDQTSQLSDIDYLMKAKEAGLHIEISFNHSDDGIRIEVTNNLSILPSDEKKLRSKLHEGMGHEDLVSFLASNADNDGSDANGMAINLLLLKAENIDPSLFRVATRKGFTTSRVEIPLSANFKSIRSLRSSEFEKV